ncbi:hypothetical protein DCC26_00600 [Auritidibacter sp. NML120779]|nr:hypothetical protein DCC26_00600 [Auritidibacter sp. NML120779]
MGTLLQVKLLQIADKGLIVTFRYRAVHSPHTATSVSTRAHRGLALLAGLALVGSLGLSGCVESEHREATPDGNAAPTHVAPDHFPDNQLGDTGRWILNQINGNRAIDRSDWYDRVAPELTEQIPVDSLVGTLNAELRPQKPYVMTHYEQTDQASAMMTLTPDISAQPLDLHFSIDEAGRLTELWYRDTNDPSASADPSDEASADPS